MSQIEKGCMAIVINGKKNPKYPTNIGKIVTVGHFLGDNIWAVDKPMITDAGTTVYYNLEENLHRIDDTDTEHQPNYETEKEIAR